MISKGKFLQNANFYLPVLQEYFPFFAFHQDIGMVAAHWILWKFSISGWIYAPATFILAMVICTLIYFILTRLHLGFLIGK